MATVLIVDADHHLIDALTRALEGEGHEVASEVSGRRGRAAGCRLHPEVALIDEALPDVGSLDLLRVLRRRTPATSVVLMTPKEGDAAVGAAVRAMRAGAFDVITKPFTMDHMLEVVRQAVARHVHKRRDGERPAPLYARRRVVPLVARLVTSPDDVPKTDAWAALVGMSTGGLRSWCNTAGLWPDHLLELGRMLRLAHQYDGGDVADYLDVMDDRTIERMLRLGSKDAPPIQFPCTINEILDAQHWIKDPATLTLLRRAIEDEIAMERRKQKSDTPPPRGSAPMM